VSITALAPRPTTAHLPGVTDDAVKDYLQKIGQISLLTAEDETELARRIEVGVLAQEKLSHGVDSESLAEELRFLVREGEAANRRFVRSNLRLVVTIAKRYVRHGVPFMDLIQEGNIGLDRAVKKFDYRQGYKFSTYATWWIRQAISRGIADSGRLIRVPVHTGEKITVVRKAIREFEVDTGRTPSIDELAAVTGYTTRMVKKLLDADQEPVSIQTPIGDESGSEFGDLIEDDDSAPVIDIITARIRQDVLWARIDALPPREAEIIRMRFGLGDGDPMTFDEVGAVFGVSRERIRQIEKRALKMLRCDELGDDLAE
jgi:RNA polymerase sigma factor (sigma-70 family)